jgi:hypothetical protein
MNSANFALYRGNQPGLLLQLSSGGVFERLSGLQCAAGHAPVAAITPQLQQHLSFAALHEHVGTHCDQQSIEPARARNTRMYPILGISLAQRGSRE